MNSRTTAAEDRLARIFCAARFGVVLTLAAVAGVYAWLGHRLAPRGGAAVVPAMQDAPSPAVWPEPTSFDPSGWAVFRSGQSPTAQGPLASRFRLAGTFFVYAENAGASQRVCKAILDDVQEKRQYLVAEGDLMGDVEVRRILTDRVVLYAQGREEELFLSFAGREKNPAAVAGAPDAAGGPPDEAALETTAFGKRVGENRWVIQRDALLGYYEQMKNDPERVALLYESFKPDYRPDGAIAGYRIGIEGEREFLTAIGLKEGDAIRKVNSLQMSSQSRAEYFIGEFARNRLGAVVLDLERDGKSEKLIYMIR